jgi:hypothetical protein
MKQKVYVVIRAFSLRTRKQHENLSLDGQSISQDFNPVLPEYKSNSDILPNSNLNAIIK